MTKRDKIALSLWYERQPLPQAAVWNTRHKNWPQWLQLSFARYMSWRHMGGDEKWFRKPGQLFVFWMTVLIFKFLSHKRS